MNQFLQALEEQRWDDHRYYHHSRINQSLHLVSAISFLTSYVLLFVDPAFAAILAWCVSMTTRQSGLVVPASVIQRGPDGAYAFVVKDDQTVAVQPVKVAQIENGEALVDEGLAIIDAALTATQVG